MRAFEATTKDRRRRVPEMVPSGPGGRRTAFAAAIVYFSLSGHDQSAVVGYRITATNKTGGPPHPPQHESKRDGGIDRTLEGTRWSKKARRASTSGVEDEEAARAGVVLQGPSASTPEVRVDDFSDEMDVDPPWLKQVSVNSSCSTMLPCNDTTMFESAWSRCTSGEGNYEPAVTQAAFSCVSGKHGRAAASSSGRETSTSILFPRPPQGLTSKLLSDSASAAKRSRNKDEKSADRQREKNLGPRLGLAGQHGAPDDDDGDMELVAATIAALSLKKPTPPTSDTPSSFEPYETDSLLDRGGATIHSSASTPGSTSATSSGAGRAGGRAHHFPFLPTSAPQEQFLAPSTLVSRQDEQEQYGHLLSALRHTALRNETIVELRAAGAGSSSIDEARRRISRTSARTSVSPSQTDVEDGLQLPRSSADHWQRPARLQASRSEQPGTKEKEKRQRASPGGSARPGHSTGLLDQRDWEMTEKSSSSAQDEQGHNQMDHHQQFLLSTAVVAAFGGRPGLLASSRSAAGESSLPQQEERDGHEATSFMARQLHVRPPPRSWSRQHQQEEAGASTASTRPGRWYEQQRTGARGSGVFDGRGAALGPEYRTRTPSPAGAFSVRSWSSNSSQSLGEEGSPEAEPQEDSTSTRVDTFDSLPDCDVDGVEGPAQQRLPLPGDDSNDTANPSAAGGFPVGATTPGAAAPLTTPGVPAPPQAPCPEDDQAMF